MNQQTLKDIDRLTRRMKDLYAEKDRHNQAQELRTERERLINSLPRRSFMEFYCECHGDFVAEGNMVTFKDQYGQLCAYYVASGLGIKLGDRPNRKFQVCHVKRWVTDKVLDPYYVKSKALNRLRKEMADDLLQPDDPRFKQLYGDIYAKKDQA